MSSEELIVSLGVQDKGSTTQIKALSKELKSLDSQYKTAQKGGTGFESSLSGLGTKLTLLNSKYDANKAKLTAYKSQLDKAKEGVTRKKEELEKLKTAEGDNTAAIQKAEKQLATYQQQMHNAENAIALTEAEMANLTVEINNTSVALHNFPMQQFGENLQKIGDKMINLGNGMQATGTTLMKLSAPFVALGGAAVKSAIDFESAFTGVVKTVDATDEQLADLRESILEMSKTMPESASSIAGVAEAAGQLGIKTENIEDFTKTMIMLGDATNLSSDEAATSLARLANITGMSQENFSNLGSTIVALGNNFATTESEITNMALRLAGAGAQIGLSEADITGLAAALSSVGIEAEAGGSAFSKVMVNMQLATETGGESLEEFARVAGMSADEFKTAFQTNAAGAITSFITGLSKCEENGTSAIKVLDDMGISEVRLRDALLRAAGSSDIFSEAISLSNTAWNENTALTKEAETRYKTMQSQIEICKNKLKALGIEIGQQLMPYVSEFIDGLGELVDWFSSLDSGTQKFIVTSGLMTFATGGVLKVVGSLTTGIGGLTKGIGGLILNHTAATTATTALGTATTGVTTSAGLLSTALNPLGLALLAIGGITAATAIKMHGLYTESSLYEEGCARIDGTTYHWQKASDETISALKPLLENLETLNSETGEPKLVTVKYDEEELEKFKQQTDEINAILSEGLEKERVERIKAIENNKYMSEEAKQFAIDQVNSECDARIERYQQLEADRIALAQKATAENRELTMAENLQLKQIESEMAMEREIQVASSEEEIKGIKEKYRALEKNQLMDFYNENKFALEDNINEQIKVLEDSYNKEYEMLKSTHDQELNEIKNNNNLSVAEKAKAVLESNKQYEADLKNLTNKTNKSKDALQNEITTGWLPYIKQLYESGAITDQIALEMIESIMNINGTPIDINDNSSTVKRKVNELIREINSIPSAKTITITAKGVMTGNVSVLTGSGGRWTMEEGGTVNQDSIVYTNEKHAGFELVEGNAVELASDSFGSLTALSAGARVYNNMTSIEMMQEEIARQLSQVDFGSYYSKNTAASRQLVSNYNSLNKNNTNSDIVSLLNNMCKNNQTVIQLLEKLNNKDNSIYMNGRQVGRTIASNVDEELAYKNKRRW